jgi:hypothetical protein
MAYNVEEDQKWVFLLRKWVYISRLTHNTLHEMRSEVLIAVLLKVHVF